MARGLLHLTVLSANGLRKHERFGKQSCYVQIQLRDGSSRTRTCKDGGSSPVWNETLFFQLDNEQSIVLRVLAERLLMKDVELGTATLSLDQVLLHGNDDSVLPLMYKGSQQGTLSVSLELRTSTVTTHSRNSSSSLASQPSSASLAFSQSGSFTGQPGLKPSSLPVMLLQTPNLALYREQLLQQSALLAQQQQQQQQRAQGLARSSTGAASSSGASGGGSSRKLAWVPKRTAADLFTDPSSINSLSEAPDLMGMFGAAASTFSDCDSDMSHSSAQYARQPVDAERVQALLNAVYGGSAAAGGPAGVAGARGASASASAPGQGMGGAGSSSTAGSRGTSPNQSRAGVTSLSPPGSSSSASRQSSSSGSGMHVGSGRAAGVGAGEGMCDVFGAAGFYAAAAAAAAEGGQLTSSPPPPQRAGQQQPAGAPGMPPPPGGDVPYGFSAAAMQAAFAAAGADPAYGGSSGSDPGDDGDPNAFLGGPAGGASQHKTRSAAAAYSSGVRPAGPAGGSSIPDPFATFGGMQAAAAAAAAAMQDTDMPDPFSMTGCWYAAAAAGTAPRPDMPDPFGAAGAAAAATAAAAAAGLCGVPPAGPAPAASLRAEHHAGGTGHRGPRRHGAPLQTVVECSESPGSSARLHTLGPAAAAAAAARPPGQQGSGVLPGLAEEAPAAAGPSSAGEPAAADQWQARVAQLAKQLQERDLLVQQLQEQLQQTQKQLQEKQQQ